MSAASATEDDGQLVTICVGERFDFSDHGSFRESYRGHAKRAKFVIDMSETTYMDSSALGMMLLLREHAGGDNCDVTIVGCKPEIRKILTISNFQKLFKIH